MCTVREKFETWAAFDCLVHEFDRDDDGIYKNEHVQSMWIGYEAAASKAVPESVIKDLVNVVEFCDDMMSRRPYSCDIFPDGSHPFVRQQERLDALDAIKKYIE